MGKYLLAWLPMVLIAIANGALREKWLRAQMRELSAHQLSTVILLVAFSLYIWTVILYWPPASEHQAFGIGQVWLGLTLGFELLFGRFVAGHSWHHLLADYNLLVGRIWILIPLWVALAPYAFYGLQGRRPPVS